MKLTNENYFSMDNERKYFGATQFKSFMSCEAKTMAKLRGEYSEEPSTAMLIGSYVDAWFEGTIDQFKEDHREELFTKTGSLRSDFQHAEYIIDRIKRDDMFMRYMSGRSQVIKTGKLFGADWKIKIDSYHPKKAIVDLKVMKDFEPVWIDGQGRVPFVEAWGYDIQAAIYQSIEGHGLPFILAAATKEKEPDLGLFSIPQESIDVALEIIRAKIGRFADVKAGRVEPVRCERCEYCKKTKKLTQVVNYLEV